MANPLPSTLLCTDSRFFMLPVNSTLRYKVAQFNPERTAKISNKKTFILPFHVVGTKSLLTLTLTLIMLMEERERSLRVPLTEANVPLMREANRSGRKLVWIYSIECSNKV
jgi:hypothetical protein